MNGVPIDFWGKLQSVDGVVRRWHPLVDHCADVAACAEALLESTLLRRRLARLAGLDDLTSGQVARLCVLAVFHDLGKFCIGFQNKKLSSPPFVCGHLAELLALMFGSGHGDLQSRLWEVFPAGELSHWCGGSDDIEGLLCATISHHGRPVAPLPNLQRRYWEPTAELDPFAGIAVLVELARTWFPEAWLEATEPLPTSPVFQHAWSGLVMLADWLGSDSERFFPFTDEADGDRMELARAQAEKAMRLLGLAADPLRPQLGHAPPGYERLPSIQNPRPEQTAMLDLPAPSPEEGSIVLVEAATGSGKTEAAFVHFLRLYHAGAVDGMYFALPTRTAATQIYRRISDAVASVFPDPDMRPPVVQAVPGYISVDAVEGSRLAPFKVLWADDDRERYRYRGWAAEHPKRYLAGAIVVGTVDQVLLSALTVSHAHMRSTALLRQLVVVDEVHASDTYMTRLLESVLDQHVQASGHALLLSATLGSVAAARLLAAPGSRRRAQVPGPHEAMRRGYPRISFRYGDDVGFFDVAWSGSEKRVRFELIPEIDDVQAVARRALAAAEAGARVLVIRNTAADCIATQAALEALAEHLGLTVALFTCRERIAPHHSRYATPDRRLLDDAIEAAFGRGRGTVGLGLVAVTTQTVEQSLDLDADLLITDLCPMDVLLQRIGRLHRHIRTRPDGYETAHVMVLVPPIPDLTELIGANGKAQGRHGFNDFVYDDLRMLQATWDLLQETPEASIPHDNRSLVEGATHPDLLRETTSSRDACWGQHQQYLVGTLLAERQLADLNLVRRTVSFSDEREVLFPDEGRRPTRLGEDDRLARFEPPQPGPFGNEVKELRIPHFLVHEKIAADLDIATRVELLEGGFSFSYGPSRFRYDRLGLRREPKEGAES